jgi:glutaredoxin 3
MVKVEVYSKMVCPFCVRAKALLSHKGVEYTEIMVDQDPEKLDEMLMRSEGKRTVPQIFIGDQSIGGFDELWTLEQQGELDKLLGK